METADIGQSDVLVMPDLNSVACHLTDNENSYCANDTSIQIDESFENPDHKRVEFKHYKPRYFPPTQFIAAKPSITMKGHTAFLTFATCP